MTAPNPVQHSGPAWPPAPQRKRRLLPWILGGVALLAVLVLGVGVLAAVALSGKATPSGDAPAVAPATIAAAAPETEAPAAVKPKLSDFKLTPKVTDKDCFGSAGCNITLHVDLEIVGAVPSDDASWLIVYEVHGIEDGPSIGNLTLTGTSYEANDEVVSTSSSKSKLTIKAVSIDPA